MRLRRMVLRRMKLPRAAVLGVLALGLVGLPGCGVRLAASHATMRIRDDRVELAIPSSGLVDAGEVVITVENYTFAKRQVVLARTELQPPGLPRRLATAARGRDDKAVVAVSGTMRSATRTISGFLPTTLPSKQNLHVHLHKGARYLLFDRLGGVDRGLALSFRVAP